MRHIMLKWRKAADPGRQQPGVGPPGPGAVLAFLGLLHSARREAAKNTIMGGAGAVLPAAGTHCLWNGGPAHAAWRRVGWGKRGGPAGLGRWAQCRATRRSRGLGAVAAAAAPPPAALRPPAARRVLIIPGFLTDARSYWPLAAELRGRGYLATVRKLFARKGIGANMVRDEYNP